MADDGHVRKLREGVEPWNEWRKQNPAQPIDLSNANLQGLHLANFQLGPSVENVVSMAEGVHEVMGISVNFQNANLSNAKLWSANCQGARFDGANLQGVNFSNAELQGSSFSRATLRGAIFYNNNLNGSPFHGAFMAESSFNSVDLRDTDFHAAELQDVSFSKADLEGALLIGAILKGADVRGARNLRLNNTYIKDAHFLPNAKDPWSVLRRSYTGPNFIFLLLALIAFSLPYIGKIGFWSFVNLGQGSTQNLLKTIRQRAQEQGIDDQTIAILGLSSEKITSLSQCLSEECEQRSVLQLVFGVDQSPISIGIISMPFWLLPAILLVYNISRGVLTALVASMRDAEERSGYSPTWLRHRFVNNRRVLPKIYQKGWWQGYQPLYYMHKIISLLGIIAIAAFLINGFRWMSQVIYLPA